MTDKQKDGYNPELQEAINKALADLATSTNGLAPKESIRPQPRPTTESNVGEICDCFPNGSVECSTHGFTPEKTPSVPSESIKTR